MRELILIAICLIQLQLNGQYSFNLLPPTSPRVSKSTSLSYAQLSINYGSPSVNGRTIFGSLEPWEKVWRAGANKATTFTTDTDIMLANETVSAGTYSLFLIPHEHKAWELILNKQADQWGSFKYDETEDFLRIDVMPDSVEHVEKLAYSLEATDHNSGILAIQWASFKIEVAISVDIGQSLSDELSNKLAEMDSSLHFVLYLQAAEYVIDQLNKPTEAFKFILKAEEHYYEGGEWNTQFYPKAYILGHIYWTKAKTLAAMHKYEEALYYINSLKNIGGEYNFYKKNAEKLGIDEESSNWNYQAQH